MIFNFENGTFLLGKLLYPIIEITDGIFIDMKGDLIKPSSFKTGKALSAVTRHMASFTEAILIGIKPEFNMRTSELSIKLFLII